LRGIAGHGHVWLLVILSKTKKKRIRGIIRREGQKTSGRGNRLTLNMNRQKK